MKRSDMVKYIQVKLESIGYTGNSDDGEKILDFIEEKGMLPPEIDSGLYSRADCQNYWVSEWEEEDEKIN